MSYILEALKKDAADSDPVAAAEFALRHQSPERGWLPWVILGALLLNMLILGLVFGPQWLGSSAQSPTTPPEAISTPAASRELTVRPRTRTAPGDANASSSQPAPASSQQTRPAASQRPPQATASNPATPPASAGAGRVLSPEEAARLNLIPADSITIGPATPATPAAARTASPALQPSQQQTQPERAPSESPASRSAKVIQLAELPPADRQDFPKLEFSTHIFADDPALRAVVVNSKRLAEGESIGEMVLRAVTEDGILVDYRGYRVAVSVLEEWN